MWFYLHYFCFDFISLWILLEKFMTLFMLLRFMKKAKTYEVLKLMNK